MPCFIDVDSFAGGGGASLGIEAALGKPVDIAINHDPEAIAMHAANHLGTRHYTCKHRLGIVTVGEIDYRLVDIGMRMLTPRELFRAQGFPDDYVIAPLCNGRPLTKIAQIRMCGNSVCPDAAEALARANVPASATRLHEPAMTATR